MNKNNGSGIIGAVVILLLAVYFVPWKNVNWGKIEMSPGQIVTVTGEAETKERNQLAKFGAGVRASKEEKQEAIDEVNKKVDDLIKKVLDFGIEKEDIKTQSLSIYQQDSEEKRLLADEEQKEDREWRVSNTVEIILRDVDRASELVDLLGQTGATDVYGPNFSIDDTSDLEDELMEDAIKNAKEKAEKIAKASGRDLGEVVSVNEGTTNDYGIMRAASYEGLGGGAPLEPGTRTISKSLTVIFELK